MTDEATRTRLRQEFGEREAAAARLKAVMQPLTAPQTWNPDIRDIAQVKTTFDDACAAVAASSGPSADFMWVLMFGMLARLIELGADDDFVIEQGKSIMDARSMGCWLMPTPEQIASLQPVLIRGGLWVGTVFIADPQVTSPVE